MPANEFYKNSNFERINVEDDFELWKFNGNGECSFPEFIKYEVIKD